MFWGVVFVILGAFFNDTIPTSKKTLRNGGDNYALSVRGGHATLKSHLIMLSDSAQCV